MEKETWLSRLKTLSTDGKARKWIIAAGLLGMALIFLSEFWPSSTQTSSAGKTLTSEEFVQKLEQRLTEVVGNIDGAGQNRVMVTLENGVQYVYATEQKTGSNRVEDTGDSSNRLSQQDDSEESVIVVDAEDGRKGLLVTELEPIVKGVVVVCEGGDQEDVQQRVSQAVTTALNITSKRVYVTKLST